MAIAQWRSGGILSLTKATLTVLLALSAASSVRARQAPAPAPTVRQSGTVKAISRNSITLAPDSGPEVTIVVQEGAKLLRVAPGQKDLKDAKPIQLSDIQIGDRILARGTPGAVANSFSANSIVDMALSDLVAKQAKDREEWQRHGVGGLVASADATGGVISITTAALGDKKSVKVT